MMRLLSFNSLITPLIVKILYVVGIVGAVAGALGVYGSLHWQLGFIGAAVVALLAFCIGVLVARVGAEMILVLFMIRDELAWQRERAQSGR